MIINGRQIGPDSPPYIIAEISCNHGGSLDRALELIDAAKSSGADAVKFQCYTADTITIDCDRPEFTIKGGGPWAGRNLHALYRETQTPFEWFPQLARRAGKIGIAWFASCFDKTSVELMVELNAAAIKIASFEITDAPLIKYAANARKPLIISTGMATDMEVRNALEAAAGCETAILHCVSGYPTPPGEANLKRVIHLADNFLVEVGISDHSMGSEIPIAATVLGASIIEKHFRLFWHPDTEDSSFSPDETDFVAMTGSVRNVWQAMQPSSGGSETPQHALRRSLFAVADIKSGQPFTEANVRSIRPGAGLSPSAIDMILGRFASRDIARGEPMGWEMLK